MKNTTLCGKILHFVVNYSFCGTISHLCGTISHFCGTISHFVVHVHFVVYLWYICDIFVVFFAMGGPRLLPRIARDLGYYLYKTGYYRV